MDEDVSAPLIIVKTGSVNDTSANELSSAVAIETQRRIPLRFVVCDDGTQFRQLILFSRCRASYVILQRRRFNVNYYLFRS